MEINEIFELINNKKTRKSNIYTQEEDDCIKNINGKKIHNHNAVL